MPAREYLLERLIREVLRKNPGYGSTELYEAVSSLYCKIKGRRTKLSKSLFYGHLGQMIDKGLVDERGGNIKGKSVEHFLTEIGDKQTYQHSLEIPTRTNKTQLPITKDNIPKELQALYLLILYFNQGIAYITNAEDELENILRRFGLSTLISSDPSIVKSDVDEIRQVIFQSPTEDAIIFKEEFLKSDIHERGTLQYRCFLRGISCKAIIENREIRAFRHFGFTSYEIRSALESLCNINALKPTGLTDDNDVMYKVDKSLFNIMFALHSLAGYDVFNKIESIMTEIWSNVRPPADDEKNWLYFIYGNKEADRIINNAYESRNKITNGESMKSYISKIRRNDKVKLGGLNKKMVDINEEITRVVDFMKWIQESYITTIDRHKTLLKNIYEIVYPDFFSKMNFETFK